MSNKRVISDSTHIYKLGDSFSLESGILSQEESHHLINVLRLKIGDTLEIFFKKLNACFIAEIISDKPEIQIQLNSEIKIKAPKRVHLVVALIKPSLCELIIEKCTELGVSSISFFQAEHHREGAVADHKKTARFEKIRNAALKQSKTFVQTEIKLHKNLASALNTHNKAFGAFLTLEQAPGIIELLTSSSTNLENSSNYDDLYLVIGPEAGLTKGEIEVAKSAGAVAASLGENILRTETASIVSTGIAMCFAW